MKRLHIYNPGNPDLSKQLKAQDELTLSGALEKALENNYGLIISRADLQMAEINNNWGNAGRYPTIGFDASDNNTYELNSENLYQVAFRQEWDSTGYFLTDSGSISPSPGWRTWRITFGEGLAVTGRNDH